MERLSLGFGKIVLGDKVPRSMVETMVCCCACCAFVMLCLCVGVGGGRAHGGLRVDRLHQFSCEATVQYVGISIK